MKSIFASVFILLALIVSYIFLLSRNYYSFTIENCSKDPIFVSFATAYKKNLPDTSKIIFTRLYPKQVSPDISERIGSIWNSKRDTNYYLIIFIRRPIEHSDSVMVLNFINEANRFICIK